MNLYVKLALAVALILVTLTYGLIRIIKTPKGFHFSKAAIFRVSTLMSFGIIGGILILTIALIG